MRFDHHSASFDYGDDGEQSTLEAVADVADRWNVPDVNPETFGSSFDHVEKTVFQTAVVRDSTEETHDAYERLLDDAVPELR